ncbi:hypothetical protein ACFT30_00875 [Microbacterium ureisolvens]|uniref:hypothetical protein n=1 Tax=Microbacterium TaxID=33882 RepID=UPI001888295C|nr:MULTISPECIES: hypothetical protein [Microbacterium]
MMSKKKWIGFGVAGAVGLTLVGGAAAATAATMNLQTSDGTVIPGGALVGPQGKTIDPAGVTLRVTDTSASVVTAVSPAPSPAVPSPATAASPVSPVTAVSAATPVSPPPPAPAPAAPAPAPAPAPAADSPASAGSVASAWSD